MHLHIFTLLLLFASSLCGGEDRVIVSIAPYRAFVREIAGDLVDVRVVVPPGASSHTYEPSSRQMIALSSASLWFRMGDGFEKRLFGVFKNYNPSMKVVDLRNYSDMICDGGHHHHPGGGRCSEDHRDVHTWLSVREVAKQAQAMAEALKESFPEKSARFDEGLKRFLARLSSLDSELKELLAPYAGSVLLVSHPAYGYFARDYGLKQLSIEFEGRDPTPQQLTELLKEARRLKVCKVYIQPQLSSKGAKLIAKELGAETVNLDPLSEEYFDNMRLIAKSFACGEKKEGRAPDGR